jgi:hypothetical protein
MKCVVWRDYCLEVFLCSTKEYSSKYDIYSCLYRIVIGILKSIYTFLPIVTQEEQQVPMLGYVMSFGTLCTLEDPGAQRSFKRCALSWQLRGALWVYYVVTFYRYTCMHVCKSVWWQSCCRCSRLCSEEVYFVFCVASTPITLWILS